jgi:hypothetical protein
MSYQRNLFDRDRPSFSRTEAERRRNLGQQRAEAHAEAEHDGWKHEALLALAQYLGQRGQTPFLAENLREWSIAQGVTQPPEPRAWGALIQSAKRRGLIRACGTERAATSNLSPKVLWVRTERRTA